MKVLMLGWEFPPHISGGLGTACYGLTQGLAKHGVEVAFVVPKIYGDEDQRSVDLVGCNRLRMDANWTGRGGQKQTPADARRAAANSAGDSRSTTQENAVAVEGAVAEDIAQFLELVTVDSPLGPYLTEDEYRQRFETARQWKEGGPPGGPQGGSGQSAGTQFDPKVVADVRRAWGELLPDGSGSSAWRDQVFAEGQTFEFSGVYGPDLLTEVARYAIAVAQVAESRDFDVVHAHDWMTYPAGLVAAKISGRPLVVHMHATEYDRSGENVNHHVRELEQMGLDGADLVVPVSNYTSRILEKRYCTPRAKMRVVHNAVSQDDALNKSEWEKTIDEPIVLFLGRVTFQKGPDYFLEAAAKVIAVIPKVKFVLAGSGDMLAPMIERAARLGLGRHFHFPGFLKGKDVERMYGMANIYVMPSVSEPFGISPLEAMALDVPVIVSKQSGVSEILTNALKVDFWDIDGMANQIIALLKYPALREDLLNEGRTEVKNLRWEVPAAKVRDIYMELVG